MRTAVVLGSTGLIGRDLVEILARQRSYDLVLSIGRQSLNPWSNPSANSPTSPPTNPKVRYIKFDFKNWGELELQIRSFAGLNTKIFDFFCCLGTTLRKAGSTEAFKQVDLHAVAAFARVAQTCRANKLVVVSSVGANPTSSSFYLKVKGEMELMVQKEFTVGQLIILRPSLLLGDRTEFRPAERLAMLVSGIVAPLMVGSLKKFKPVRSIDVARAMLALALSEDVGAVGAKNIPTSAIIIEGEKLNP